MAQSVLLPDGSSVTIREGETPESAYARAQQMYPEAFGAKPQEEKKPESGIMAALGSGFRGGVGEAAESAGAFAGLKGLQAFGKRQQEQAEKNYAPTTDEQVAAAGKEGFLSDLGASAKQFLEPYAKSAGSIAGRFGAPTLAAAGTALALPEALAAAPLLGGSLGAVGLGTVGAAAGAGAMALADAPIEIGQKKLERERAGLPPDPLKDIQYGLTATALNTVTGGVLSGPIKGVLGRSAAQQAAELAPRVLAGEITSQEAAGQISGLLKNVLHGTAENAAVGTGMMVGNEALSRASVGQDLTSPEAREKYLEATKGALALAPMFGLAHGIGARGAAERTLGEAGAARTAEQTRTQQAADTVAAAQEEARKQSPEYIGQVEQQYADLQSNFADLKEQAAAKVEPTDLAGMARLNDAKKALKDFMADEETKKTVQEYNRVQKLKPQEVAPAAEAPAPVAETPAPVTETTTPTAPAVDPRQQLADITAKIEALQTQAQGATPEQLVDFGKQHRDLKKQQADVQKVVDTLPPPPPAPLTQPQVLAKIKRVTTAMNKANENGDIDIAGKHAATLLDLQNQLQAFEKPVEKPAAVTPEGTPAETAAAPAAPKPVTAQPLKPYTGIAEQGLMFPETGKAESTVNLGQGKPPAKSRQDLMAEFQAAKQVRDRLGMQNAIEQMRVLDERSKARSAETRGVGAPKGALTSAALAQDILGQKLTATGSQAPSRELTNAAKTKTTPDMLRQQIDALPENLSPSNKELVGRLQDNFKEFTADPERAELAAGLLHDLRTGVETHRARDVANELDVLDATKEHAAPTLFNEEEAPVVEGPRKPLPVVGYSEEALPSKPSEQQKAVAAHEKKAAELEAKRKALDEEREEHLQKVKAETDKREKAALQEHNDAAVLYNRLEKEQTAKLAPIYADYVDAMRNPGSNKTAAAKRQLDTSFAYETAKANKKAALADAKADMEKTKAALDKVRADNKKALADAEKAIDTAQKETRVELKNKGKGVEEERKQEKPVQSATRTKPKTTTSLTERENADAAKRKAENERAERLASIPGESVSFEAHRRALATLDDVGPRLEELSAKAADESLPESTRNKAKREIKKLSLARKFLESTGEGNGELRLQAEEELAKLKEKIKTQAAAVAEKATASRKQELAKSKRRERELTALVKGFKSRAERAPIDAKTSQLEDRIERATAAMNKARDAGENKVADMYAEKIKAMHDELQGFKDATAAAYLKSHESFGTTGEVTPEMEALLEKINDPQASSFEVAQATKEYKMLETNRLPARKVGPVVRKAQAAANIRTGEGGEAGIEARRVAPGAKPTQGGATKAPTPKKAVEDANKVAEEKIANGKELTATDIKMLDLRQHFALFEAAQNMRRGLERNLAELKEKMERAAQAVNPSEKSSILREERLAQKAGIERDIAIAKKNEERLGKIYGEEAPAEEAPKTVKKAKKTRAQKTVEDLGEEGAVYRTKTSEGAGMNEKAVARLADRITAQWKVVPEIEVVATEKGLPEHIQEQARRDNMTGKIPGLYDTETKKVYLVAENLHTGEDVALTVAHEIAGHFGLREMLGSTYKPEMSRIYEGNKDVAKQADAKMQANARLSRDTAVEEVLAEMAENGQESGLRRIYNVIKHALSKFFGLKNVTDKEVRQVVSNALRYVQEGEGGRGGEAAVEGVNYRTAKYSPALKDAGEMAERVVDTERPLTERVNGSSFGRAAKEFEIKAVDQYAGVLHHAKQMEQLSGSQMQYYLRMVGQRLNLLGQAVGRGFPELKKITRPDGRHEWLYESKDGSAALVHVAQKLQAANKLTGSEAATNNLFSLYEIAKRADDVGIDKMNYSADITKAKLDKAVQQIKSVPGLSAIFDDAHESYRDFNKDGINFAVSTGALSKELGAKLLANKDYVPYYRESPDGTVSLWMGNEAITKVGNVKDQPYLHELVGGNTRIVDFTTSSVRNANMLLDMGLRNQATKNVANELKKIGLAEIHKGQTRARPNVIQFKVDGVDHYANIESTPDMPAELLVKGMAGIPVQTSALLKMVGAPSRLLRHMFVANPISAGRILFKDTISSAMVGGSNFDGISAAFKNVGDNLMEKRGLSGGETFTGLPEDLTKILRQVQTGKPGWENLLAKGYAMHAKADAMTRQIRYESYRKQGLSEMEASLQALESMNFTRRGISPSLHLLSAINPFMNSQIQGVNTLVKALRGNMPFNEKLKIREKIIQRGMMLAGATMLYTTLMQDDDTYKKATPEQRYNNFLVPFPGLDEKLRVPIPFEAGLLFKSVPEALVNYLHGHDKDAATGMRMIIQKMIPGGDSEYVPQILKPAIEVGLGKSFYTGRDLESKHEQSLVPSERSRDTTSGLATAMGHSLGLDPIMVDHLINGYTGSLGLAVTKMASSLVFGGQPGVQPEKTLSQQPIISTLFQPQDAGNIVEEGYQAMKEAKQVQDTVKDLIAKNRIAEAKAFLEKNATEYAKADLEPKFASAMNQTQKALQAIAASTTMTPAEKRTEIDKIKALRSKIAEQVMEAADKTKRP